MNSARVIYSTLAIGASMVFLFLIPSNYFVPGTFVVTGEMVSFAVILGAVRRPNGGWTRATVVGLSSAALLYLTFYAGNAAVNYVHLEGVGTEQERSIYSLIASPSNPLVLQAGVLVFDALGYESYFRGVLQGSIGKKYGLLAAPAVALFDALLHLATFNLLWVATTFVADLAWGMTFYFGRGARGSFVSHLVWDFAIFIIRPIV